MNSQLSMQAVILIGFVVIMYFFLIRPQRKKDKEIKEMRDSIRVGDMIVTIGGIMGKVVKTKDESIVIQVGADKTKIEFKKWAVSSIEKKADRKAAPKDVEPDTAEQEDGKKRPRRLGKKDEKPAEDVKAAVEETAQAVENTAEQLPEAAEAAEAVEVAE